MGFGARKSMACNAGIVETIKGLQGPEIFWGSDGVLAGFDESDIKGYEGFSKLAAAIEKEGIDLSSGDFTILAPTDAAFDKHDKEVGTPITADILKYHVIPGKKTLDQLNSDQKTLEGGTLTSYRKFRKNWLVMLSLASSLRVHQKVQVCLLMLNVTMVFYNALILFLFRVHTLAPGKIS